MGFAPSDYIRAGQRDVTDGFGHVGRAGSREPGVHETLAETRARLTADTPENNRRKAIVDEAVAKIEKALRR